MTRKALPASPPTTHRTKRRKGEVSGGAAAECAAVCCCCPCGMMNLLILTVYKVPKGICKKAWLEIKKTSSSKKALLPKPTPIGLDGVDDEYNQRRTTAAEDDLVDGAGDMRNDKSNTDDAAFEKEMWDRFYGNGFFRSESLAKKEQS